MSIRTYDLVRSYYLRKESANAQLKVEVLALEPSQLVQQLREEYIKPCLLQP